MHINIGVALKPNFMSNFLKIVVILKSLTHKTFPQKLFDYDCVTLYQL